MRNISFRNDVLPLKNILYRLALRVTLSHEDAEDIVQDTLLRVWNKRDDWQDIDSIKAYSLAVCRNLALDKARRADTGNRPITDSDASSADTAGNPYERAARKDRIALVRSIVDGLPEKQRSCLQLRDFEGLSYREIAASLDMTEEQVKINIYRARQAVRRMYEKYDGYGL